MEVPLAHKLLPLAQLSISEITLVGVWGMVARLLSGRLWWRRWRNADVRRNMLQISNALAVFMKNS